MKSVYVPCNVGVVVMVVVVVDVAVFIAAVAGKLSDRFLHGWIVTKQCLPCVDGTNTGIRSSTLSGD